MIPLLLRQADAFQRDPLVPFRPIAIVLNLVNTAMRVQNSRRVPAVLSLYFSAESKNADRVTHGIYAAPAISRRSSKRYADAKNSALYTPITSVA